MSTIAVTGKITSIVGVGGRTKRPYIVIFPLEEQEIDPLESITIGLNLWTESQDPEVGQIVTLSNITKHTRGWRANTIAPVTPRTQKPE